ncbi:MAG: glycyl-radical enzyme activating protein [Promethearchaeota archaeon]
MVESDKGLIFEIQKMSTEDGPGIRTTVFFKQCPLRCIWCHNPESILKIPQLEWIEHKCIGCKTCIETCKQNALTLDQEGMHIDRDKCISCGDCVKECPSTALHMFGEWWNINDLYHEIQKDKVYYQQSKGGITASGGEPTLQSDFLLKFLKKCKENDISTALDTCGFVNRNTLEKLLPFVDLVLLDIKEINSEKHKEFTGVSNKLILENAEWIVDYVKCNQKKIWIRTPIIPNYTATEENVEGIGNFIVKKLNNIPERWDLLAFNNLCTAKYERLDMNWSLKGTKLMTKAEIEFLYHIAIDTGVKNVQWSGLTQIEEKN